MLFKSPRAWFSLPGLLLLASSVQAQFVHYDHHPPYVDPHFDLHHTPLYDYGARPTYSGYGAYTATGSQGSTSCGVCNGDGSSARGSRGPSCPPIENAILQLYVPDGFQVEVNGYPTKPQRLGGIHKNSRRYSLEGLEVDRVSPCDIVVIACDEFGVTKRYHHALSVRAGQHYKVRYPQEFKPLGELYNDSLSGMVTPGASHQGTSMPGTLHEGAPLDSAPMPGTFSEGIGEIVPMDSAPVVSGAIAQ